MPYTVAIVGGGLVGSLSAVFCAKRGWKVDVYEAREDPRAQHLEGGRSINLALSVRGISAMTAAGVEKKILDNMIPMRGRMIHSREGALQSQNYGSFGECINSIDRNLMNEHLLSSADGFPNVKIHFNHKLDRCDFDGKKLTFMKAAADGSKPKEITVEADLVIGADGAYSRVRNQLMRKERVDFSQEYIDNAYLELTIPPTSSGDFAMDANHLHIWPRQTFMLIALPNTDKSFTVTLFMPWEMFAAVKTEADVLELFEKHFADSVPLIGKEALLKDFFEHKPESLIQVKCRPYHYKDRAVILGDAAHAMVPFYGQGMNCGMEDCLVLDELITEHLGRPSSPSSRSPSTTQMSHVLAQYTLQRNRDVEAMCDLAMYNYVEMRDSVTKKEYLYRKKIEGWLHKLMPERIIPLYTMVSFSRIPYAEAMRRWQQQTRWFNLGRKVVEVAGWGLIASLAFYVGKRWRVTRGMLQAGVARAARNINAP
ncbi:uncharacterized protein EV422DRAFT_11150 [Fimicolochytrium jonesii]|uniref:uncharacterized protein n=1 Tax=Fimicolochytrium jonesii TaxID=1396493 RepID=UPI0022FEDEB7|nr:uncharacterized protein EV422DRAFT_11150 [Fimicolochytrium jonesii]KAI8826802.1 hypothetical protein EV422DRAFT_11150 [Fimicolochytrium jonesii]